MTEQSPKYITTKFMRSARECRGDIPKLQEQQHKEIPEHYPVLRTFLHELQKIIALLEHQVADNAGMRSNIPEKFQPQVIAELLGEGYVLEKSDSDTWPWTVKILK